MQVFDRVNDSRFWKSFITCYGANETKSAPTWTAEDMPYAPAGVKEGDKRFSGGELGMKYIVNDPGDNRYEKYPNAPAYTVLKDGKMCNTYTYVRYFKGQEHSWNINEKTGNYYDIIPHKRSVALSKFRDGYRVSIASQFGTRDAIIARSADDVLMVAEAYIRKGEANYDKAVEWMNKLRERAGYKTGEDRSKNVDGGQAYKNNPPRPGPGGVYPGLCRYPQAHRAESPDPGLSGAGLQLPKRFALQLLSAILGGGVSSRLFQQVREQQGLCYSIYSYGAGHAETGVFCIYTALNKETEAKALATIRRVIDDFLAKGPTTEELERAREQSKANVIMGLESTQSRMSHAGRSLLFSGEILTPEQIIDAYDRVTREDVVALAQEIFDWERASLSAVGQVRTAEEYRQLVLG